MSDNCYNASHHTTIRIDESTRIYLKCRGYSIDNQIGTGTYGIVFDGKKLTPDSNEEVNVAVKVIDKCKKIFNVEMYHNEMRAMQRLQNVNIIRSYALFETTQLIMIFMDLAQDGDLLTLLLRNGALGESGSQQLFRQIVSGLNYMHEICWMAHLDVKCDNILLHKGTAKLSDFGFTSIFCPIYTEVNFQKKRVGTFEYNPPQLMYENPSYFPPKVDVYSTGITLFIMVFGRFLFVSVEKNNEKKQNDIRNQQLRYLDTIDAKLSYKYSNELRELIIKMLHPSELFRPAMKEILKNAWLKKEHFPKLINGYREQTSGPTSAQKNRPNHRIRQAPGRVCWNNDALKCQMNDKKTDVNTDILPPDEARRIRRGKRKLHCSLVEKKVL